VTVRLRACLPIDSFLATKGALMFLTAAVASACTRVDRRNDIVLHLLTKIKLVR